jgi:N6-adenosine-specific RNA methylase IME4
MVFLFGNPFMQNQSLSGTLETKLPTPPEDGYRVIYADPPWNFATRSEKGEGRSPKNHYQVMKLDDIKAMPVSEIAANDAHLFMWTTAPHLVESLEVVKAWGFEYSTLAFTWVKSSYKAPRALFNPECLHWGMGYTTRSNAEFVIYGRRGRPMRSPHKNIHSVFIDHGCLEDYGDSSVHISPVREHSRKPEEIRKRIELLAPGPYIELFARERAEGWDAWGNDIGKFDQ